MVAPLISIFPGAWISMLPPDRRMYAPPDVNRLLVDAQL